MAVRVRFSIKIGDAEQSFTQLAEIPDLTVRTHLEQQLTTWCKSVREAALRTWIEQETNEDIARAAQITFFDGEPEK